MVEGWVAELNEVLRSHELMAGQYMPITAREAVRSARVSYRVPRVCGPLFELG